MKFCRLNLYFFMLCFAAAGLCFASGASTPTRENRLNKDLLRSNQLFAEATLQAPSAEKVKLLSEKESVPKAPEAQDIQRIKNLDHRYQSAASVSMRITKTLHLTTLGTTRVSDGKILVSHGRVRVEINPPEKSLFVVDGEIAWLVNYPSEDFKGAALQIVKTSVAKQKKSRPQALISLLAQGGLLKCFKVVGVRAKDNVFFLQPKEELSDLQRAKARLSADGKDLAELTYWDEFGNQTDFNFSKVTLGGAVDAKNFKFSPPADADITTF